MQGTSGEPIDMLCALTEHDEALANIRLCALALESISDGALIVDASDPDLPIVYSNPAFQTLTGYTARETVGQNCGILRGAGTDSGTVERIYATLRTGNMFDGQILNYRKDGTSFWNLLRISPLRDVAGRITHFVGLQTDITGFKQAQDRLHESENRFRVLANTAPVMVWMSGLDKGCNFFNQRWLDFTGRSMEQELGNGWALGVHPDDIDCCSNTYANAFDRRDDFVMEYRLRRHDGQYRWVIDTGTPRYAPEGVFTGYIGSCIDITDRKLAEKTSRQEKQFSNSIIDSLPGLFFMLNRKGCYVRWNKNAERLAGHSAGEMKDRPAVDFVVPEDREKFRQAIEAGFRLGHVSAEYHHLTKDGRKIPYVSYGVRANIGCREYLVGVEIDITERKRAEQDSRLLRDELTHINRLATMGELSAAVAHELNQPLTSILNNAKRHNVFLTGSNRI